MDWMGGTDEWVIARRHRILVLVVLQCLLIGSFSNTIGAAKYRVDEFTELHRSMARYRQLREFENSERDLIQIVEEKMKKGEGKVNLKDIGQQQQEGSESNLPQESKELSELENPAGKTSKQSQGGSKKHAGYESKKLPKLESPTEGNSELGQQPKGDLEKDVEHEIKMAKGPNVDKSNETSELEQQQQVGLEAEMDHRSKNVHQIEKPSDDNSGDRPEPHQQQRSGLQKDVERNPQTNEQQQDELRKGPKDEEPFVFPKPYLLGPTIKDWDEQRGSWLEANPHMKSTLSKPRVLIVSGSLPGPCVSPVGDYFHMKSLKLKIDYARMHDFEIFYNIAWLDPLFGGWWSKLPTLRKLLLTHPEIEWFFWVDSDAVFTDMLFEPPFQTYEGYNMVMWGSEHGLYTDRSWVAFNAGVFLVRNCQWSLDLIDKWSPMGPKGPVRDEWGKIFTSFLSSRKDNFSSDDQSALAYLLITDEAARAKVKLVDSDAYTMSGFWIEVVNTYEACSEKYHPGLGDKRWPWITHFTGCGLCAGGDNPAYSYPTCLHHFERAYNFADNQVLAFMGYHHISLSSPNVTLTRTETGRPLEFVGVNPWQERIDLEAAAAAAA